MARFLLRLLEPSGVLAPCPVSRIGADGIWPFPIGAQSYAAEQGARVQVLELPTGVAVDTMGTSTPRWRLEGTFGGKPKALRGVTLSPLELTQDLIRFVKYYFDERARRTRAQAPLLEVAFDDLDRGLHWIVVPASVPQLKQNAREPARPYWSLELIGVRPAGAPPRAADPIPERLSPATPSAIGNALAGWGWDANTTRAGGGA